jgi:predicted transcriptional regulator
MRFDILVKIKTFRDKGVSFGELREEFNLNNNSLNYHLKKLLDIQFIVQKKKRGKYFINHKGKLAVKSRHDLEKILKEA